MEISFQEITPEQAAHWLDTANTNNRNWRPGTLRTLKTALESGKFHTNGDAVRFDRAGKLIDGQHRLRAIRETGISATMAVARGLDPEARLSIDLTTGRSLADQASFLGMDPKASSLIAALCPGTRPEQIDFYVKNKTQIDRVFEVKRPAKITAVAGRPGYDLGVYMILDADPHLDSDELYTWLRDLATGANLKTTDARYVLRKLCANRNSVNSDVLSPGSNSQASKWAQARMLRVAWLRRNEVVRVLHAPANLRRRSLG